MPRVTGFYYCTGIHVAMIGEETKWLDELDAKLTKGLLRASADAEELSEELDVSRHLQSCTEFCESFSYGELFFNLITHTDSVGRRG